jgi:hypothetical protein
MAPTSSKIWIAASGLIPRQDYRPLASLSR